MNTMRGAPPGPGRASPERDEDPASSGDVKKTTSEADQREVTAARRDRWERGLSIQRSRAVLAASERLRGRAVAASGRAEALRARIAATIADVAAVEEKIARFHEVLASEGAGGTGSHRRVASNARVAVLRATEIRAHLTAGPAPASGRRSQAAGEQRRSL